VSPRGACLDTRNSSFAVARQDAFGIDCFADLGAFAQITFPCRRVRRGQTAFRIGDPFSAIYAVRWGFFKSTDVHEMGHEQVVGFSMRGDLLGLDGVGLESYNCTATALEDSEIIVLPFARLQELARTNQAMQRQLHAMLSREITRNHGMMMLLGSMCAEARLASFLAGLSARFVQQGYSASDFILRMTRKDIGSYLGLKLETVSRVFSEFHRRGLLKVEKKHVRILDAEGLQRVCAES